MRGLIAVRLRGKLALELEVELSSVAGAEATLETER